MAKEKKEKKDKSTKKSKLEEPVSDASTRISKKEKKDKKDKKASAKLRTPDAASALLDALEEKKKAVEAGTSDAVIASEVIAEVEDVVGAKVAANSDLIVPFAQPLAEDKQAKKVLKCVKKGLSAPHPPAELHGLWVLTDVVSRC
jgi:H/ACA ribonucleoprotein complex subunit 2